MSTPCRMYANRFPEVDDVVMVQVRNGSSMHEDGNEIIEEDGKTMENENEKDTRPHEAVETKHQLHLLAFMDECIDGVDLNPWAKTRRSPNTRTGKTNPCVPIR